jgi:hypothetical protein
MQRFGYLKLHNFRYLLAGSIGESSLSVWDEARLSQVGAESWHRFGFRRHASGRLEHIGKKMNRLEK